MEIKTFLQPAERFGPWLNQLLGYALLDWFNILRLDALAVYLGWQAKLVVTSLAEVLAVGVSGPAPMLESLRESLRADFRHVVQADVDLAHEAQLRRQYPAPVLLAQPETPGTSS